MERKKTFDNVLTLIAIDSTKQNDLGIPIQTETTKKVFCKVLSIGQNAHFQARQMGVKWSKKFVIHSFEYEDQQLVEFNGNRFTVERIYGDDLSELELTCAEVLHD